MSELPRLYDSRRLPPGAVRIEADASERAALAERFALVSIGSLVADITLEPDGKAVAATGLLTAKIVQSCAVSGEDLPATIAEPVALRFVPASPPSHSDAEIELDAAALDEIEMDGSQFDLGEAIAQSLALAFDPFAVGPQAAAARRKAGLFNQLPSGPFAALAALKKD